MGSDKMKPSVVDQIKGVKVDIPMSGSLQEQEEEAQKKIAKMYN